MPEQNDTQSGNRDQTQYNSAGIEFVSPQSAPVQSTEAREIARQERAHRDFLFDILFPAVGVGVARGYSFVRNTFQNNARGLLYTGAVVALGIGLGYGADYLTRDNSSRDKTLNSKFYTQVDGVYFERNKNKGISLDTMMENQLSDAQKIHENSVKKVEDDYKAEVDATNKEYDSIIKKAKSEARKLWVASAEKKEDTEKTNDIDYRKRIEDRDKLLKDKLK